MGFNSEVLAIKDISKEIIWKKLGFEEIPESEALIGTANDELICGYYLPGQWYIIEFQRTALSEFANLFAAASINAQIIHLQVYECANFSSAACWQDGTFAWRLSHDISKSHTNIQAEGTPPAIFEEVKDGISKHYYAKPKEMRCDSFFSIPVAVCTLITRYAYSRFGRHKSSPLEFLRPAQNSAWAKTGITAGRPIYEDVIPRHELSNMESEIKILLEPAWDWLSVHQYDKANSILDDIELKFPDSFPVMWVRANVLEESRKERELKSVLAKMTGSEAVTRSDYFYRSMAFNMRGLDDFAKQDWEKALDQYGRPPL